MHQSWPAALCSFMPVIVSGWQTTGIEPGAGVLHCHESYIKGYAFLEQFQSEVGLEIGYCFALRTRPS